MGNNKFSLMCRENSLLSGESLALLFYTDDLPLKAKAVSCLNNTKELILLKNPNFGKWDRADDFGEFDVFGVIPSAEEEALNKINKEVRSKVINKMRNYDQSEKLKLNVKRIFPGPFSRYKSPFTKEEASQTLIYAGLENVEIVGIYLSGWPGCEYREPLGQSQVILLRQNGKLAELYLQYLKEDDIRKIIEDCKADLYLKFLKLKPLWHVIGVRKIIPA